jgi:hypothetical protein
MDANGAADIPGSVVSLVALWGLVLVIIALSHWPSVGMASAPAQSRRPLKPKTGEDCPLCQDLAMSKTEGRAGGAPRAWCDVRSRRGPEQHSDTEG